jgi:hypothetical protein
VQNHIKCGGSINIHGRQTIYEETDVDGEGGEEGDDDEKGGEWVEISIL